MEKRFNKPVSERTFVKTKIKKIVSRKLRDFRVGSLIKAALTILLVLSVNVVKAQTSFASAQVLTGDWGSVTNSNAQAASDTRPNVAGFPPNKPLWYSWTASHSGVVELDTVGSIAQTGLMLSTVSSNNVTTVTIMGTNAPSTNVVVTLSTNSIDSINIVNLDTVLGVYQGSSLQLLNQVAANDDLFPVNSSVGLAGELESPQADDFANGGITFFGQGVIYGSATGVLGAGEFNYTPPYYGPSHLKFNAVGGQTYYFAVDTKTGSGNLVLNWAYRSSGIFRFASEDQDWVTGLPLYQTSESESTAPLGNGNVDVESVVHTYYTYNAPGVLVTVTRAAGSTGRAIVDYQTIDGTSLPGIPIGDLPGISGVDYIPVRGQLVFDDFEMSKTILVPIMNKGPVPADQTNRVFGIQLINDGGATSPILDPYEDTSVSPPRVDPAFATAVIKILNTQGDPYGPDQVLITLTNAYSTYTNYISYLTNALSPTNYIFNFEKTDYRVPADIADPALGKYGYAYATLYVERGGTNGGAMTVDYKVDGVLLADSSDPEEGYNDFPLQPGSDYAVPLPADQDTVIENYDTSNYDRITTNYDFDLVDNGSISFPAEPAAGSDEQAIHIKIPVSLATKFNKDFRISLYRMVTVGSSSVPEITGMNAQATVTVLFNDENPPAGSVDEFYNADFNGDLALVPGQGPVTTPGDDSNPGVGSPGNPGQVYAIGLLANDEALIGGDFPTYNGGNGSSQNDIVLVNTNGQQDTSFNMGSGFNGAVNAIAISGNKFLVGGAFSSYQNNILSPGGIVRLNANGSLDTTFNAGGAGVANTVRAVLVQTNGEILIGGDFTSYDGIPCDYLALLNTNGLLDTNFNAAAIQGPVYSLAMAPTELLTTNLSISNSGTENDQSLNISPYTSGTLTVNYTMSTGQNDMRIFYGTTNVNASTGVAIYDTGLTRGTGTVTIPFGPTVAANSSLLSANTLTIVMNQSNVTYNTVWNYKATVNVAQSSDNILVGGNFTVAGQAYTDIARLNPDGSLDTTFNPSAGANGVVHALAWQFNNQVILGGEFTQVNGQSDNYLARLNPDGSLDTTNFFIGSGADNNVDSISLQLDGTFYVGGAFSVINGTHRLGFARLYSNGTVDTTFMDTAYNQFAGLKKIYADDTPAVLASAVQSNGGILIGGSFLQVGGGQADPQIPNSLDDELYLPYESFDDPNLWVEPKTRDGFRNRTGFARLIGGSTAGPGNIGLTQTAYSQNKSQSSLTIALVRTNGTLGPVSANFSVVPGGAVAGQDYSYQAAPPMFWIGWNYLDSPLQSRMREDGLWGVSGNGALINALGETIAQADAIVNDMAIVTVTTIRNPNNPGNQTAQFQLANPSLADNFLLGSEEIPTGAALGVSSAPFTLIDDTTYPGQFGFSSSTFIATNSSTPITLVRSNGIYGNVIVTYATTNGTAIAGKDYVGITNNAANASTTFNSPILTTNFNITILNDSSTTNVEKTFGIKITGLRETANATLGISNTIVRIINPSAPGYVTLATNSFTGSISSGVLNFTVNRIAGSLGTVTVQYATTNNTAFSGINYIGATNTLVWNSGDVSPRTVSIPLINPGVVSSANLLFGVYLSNATLNASSDPAIMGIISNAVCIITNDNSYGTLRFATTNYLVNDNGGYATLTVVRTGGGTGAVSVNYSTVNGTASAPANYTATNGVLMFAANQIAASFQVPVLTNANTQPANFYFRVNLSNPTNAALGSASNAWVNLFDSEAFSQPPGSPDPYSFNPAGMNGSVYSLAWQTNNQILAAGNFTAVGTTPEGYIARLNANGSLDTSFLSGTVGSGDDGAFGPVNSVICQTDGRIVIGGAFSTVDDANRNNIARLLSNGMLDTSFNPGPGANGAVNALAETFMTNGVRRIYVGGAFSTIAAVSSRGLARLDADTNDNINVGSVDPTFNIGSGLDGQVYTIAVYPTNSIYAGKLLVGGSFQHYNGVGVTNLVRLNVDGSLDTNFDNNLGIGPNGIVQAIAIQLDGNILVGGSFTSFNNTNANYIVRLLSNGTIDQSFVGSANQAVQGIALQPDNRILLVGQFTVADGILRNGITRLMPTGATDPTINFGSGANGDVDTLLFQPTNNTIIIGGTFNEYNGLSYDNIAGIYGGSVTGSGQFEFTSANYYVNENGSFANITIERTGGTSGTNTDGSGSDLVDFYTTNFTTINAATNGINYQATNEVVAFPPGAVFESVTVPVYDDGVIETTNLIVGLGLTGAPLGIQPTATLSIINDDNGVSFLTPPFYSVDKDAFSGVATIDIIRQGGTNSTSTVDFYTSTNGTAVIGTDYTPTNELVTFAPGVSDVQVQVAITNNNLVEGNRTVGLVLTNASAPTVMLAPSNAVLTIIDTTPSPGYLAFSTNSYFANKTDTNAYVTIIRTNGTTGSVSASLEVTPGTAVAGINYQSPAVNPIPVSFASGQNSDTIAVQLIPNNLVQGTVSFSVTLTNVLGAGVAAPTNATVSIINNINTGVEFTSGTNTVSETNGTAVILVAREGYPSNTFSVNYATTNGSALAGVNYSSTSGTLTFTTNSLFLPISVPLINQQLTTNLTFGITLSSPTNAQLLAPSNTLVVLQGSRAGLYFTNSAISVFKNVGIVAIPVVCNNPGLEPVLINTNVIPLTVSYFTANGTATASQDYTAENGILTFTNGIGTNYIFVPILNNSLITGSRTFTVCLTNATAPGEINVPSNQVVTIVDSNSGLSFSQPAYAATRSSGMALITVVRTDNTNVVSTVAFTTANGTATTNTDYFPTNGILTFTNGLTTNTFSVALISSTTVQPDKTVLLQLFNPTNGALVSPSAATLTIHDTSGSLVVPAGTAFAPGGNPNNDGLIDPGEAVKLYFGFRAEGGNTITNLYATLLPVNGITVPSSPNGTPTQVYSNLYVDGPSESQPYYFTASGTNGQQIAATFSLVETNSGVPENLGTNLFTFTLGTWTMSFTNTNSIIIGPAPINSSQSGIASPYPSVIAISNIVGTVFKTTITLTNLTHTSEYNVNALLLAPNASDTLFLSHAGAPAIGISGVTLTFSDTATNSLPVYGGTNYQAFTNGVYKPAAYGSSPTFP